MKVQNMLKSGLSGTHKAASSRLGMLAIGSSAFVFQEDIRNWVHEALAEQPNHYEVNERPADFNKEVAYHEAGHGIISLVLLEKLGTPLEKATIRQEDYAVGHVLNGDNDFETSKELYLSHIIMLYGGFAAEYYHLNRQTSGVSGDIDIATRLAIEMMMENGMSHDLWPIDYAQLREYDVLRRETHQQLDIEIENTLISCAVAAKYILEHYKSEFETLANALLDDKDHTLTGEEIKALLKYDEEKGLPFTNEEGKRDYIEDPLTHFLYTMQNTEEEPTEENETTKETEPEKETKANSEPNSQPIEPGL